MTNKKIHQIKAAISKLCDRQYNIGLSENSSGEIGLLEKEVLKLAQALEKQSDKLKTLLSITEKINAGLGLDDVLTNVYDSFKTLLPYDRIGLALVDKDQDIVTARWAKSANPTMKIVPGYSAPIKGSSLEPIIASGNPRIINNLLEYLDNKPQSESTRLITDEGMRSSLTCPLLAQGKPLGFLFFSSLSTNSYKNVHAEIYQEIAGQLAIAIEKGKLYQHLVELNDLKNKLLGIAAHDLRSPLAVIKKYIELLQDGFAGDITRPQQDILMRIDCVCKNMLSLINNLLDVSAIESGQLRLKLVETNLSSFLDEIYKLQLLLASAKNIKIELRNVTKSVLVKIDTCRIAQVIDNLIANAIKFSNPKTTIELGAYRNRNSICIYVKDNGQGIPADEIDNIFKDFGRTSVMPTAGEKSTGLGLAICKRIVEAHGGSIYVNSQPSKGSKFEFSLPLTKRKGRKKPPSTDI